MDILRGMRLKGPDPEASRYTSSVLSDRPMVKPVVEINKAHVVMLVKQGLIKAPDGSLCLKGLASIPASLELDPKLEDVHMNIEAELIRKVGEQAGGQLNLAKSRNDQVATAIRIGLRECLLDIISSLSQLQRVLLKRCSEHVGTVMPGYTHLQHAQPITLAHHLLAHFDALQRDCERLAQAYARVNMCPMGGAAMAATSFKIDREVVAGLLGFDGLVENSMDAVSARDFAVEVVADLSILMAELSRLAEELILWSTYEYSAVEIPDEFVSTSSIMPQKRNAVIPELARARASTVFGSLQAILSTIKALPCSYNLDLQEVTQHVWEACKVALSSVRVLAKMMDKVRFKERRFGELVRGDMSNASELADLLTSRLHIPFRTAHRIVGLVVRRSDEKGWSFDETVFRYLEQAVRQVMGKSTRMERGELLKSLDPAAIVQRRAVRGGPSPVQVSAMIEARKKALVKLSRWLSAKRLSLKTAEAKLAKEVASLGGVWHR